MKRPRFDGEAAKRQWGEFLRSGNRAVIESRAIRFLCWDESIAVTPEFGNLLRQYGSTPSTSMVFGLLGVCHTRWRTVDQRFHETATTLLRVYQGHNSTLRKLQTIAAEVVGAEGVYHSVASASAKEKAASELLEERGLGINTPYASSIAEALLDHHIRELEA